jgi:hypothetical protein
MMQGKSGMVGGKKVKSEVVDKNYRIGGGKKVNSDGAEGKYGLGGGKKVKSDDAGENEVWEEGKK